ncbi:MAG TPA: hypothetical protein VGI61_02520 [Parafilimonas sp.]
MKKTFYTLVIIFIAINVNAQLANTKWKTTIQTDQATDVVFNFSTDTLDVTNAGDNSDIEAMNYTLQDTVLTLRKLYGQSECDTSAVGTYSYKINGNELWIKLISDNCDDRSNVIKDIKLNKIE